MIDQVVVDERLQRAEVLVKEEMYYSQWEVAILGFVAVLVVAVAAMTCRMMHKVTLLDDAVRMLREAQPQRSGSGDVRTSGRPQEMRHAANSDRQRFASRVSSAESSHTGSPTAVSRTPSFSSARRQSGRQGASETQSPEMQPAQGPVRVTSHGSTTTSRSDGEPRRRHGEVVPVRAFSAGSTSQNGTASSATQQGSETRAQESSRNRVSSPSTHPGGARAWEPERDRPDLHIKEPAQAEAAWSSIGEDSDGPTDGMQENVTLSSPNLSEPPRGGQRQPSSEGSSALGMKTPAEKSPHHATQPRIRTLTRSSSAGNMAEAASGSAAFRPILPPMSQQIVPFGRTSSRGGDGGRASVLSRSNSLSNMAQMPSSPGPRSPVLNPKSRVKQTVKCSSGDAACSCFHACECTDIYAVL